MKHSSKNRNGWVGALLIGAVIPVLYLTCWFISQRDDGSYEVPRSVVEAAAHKQGVNVADYSATIRLMNKAQLQRRVTDDEWQQIVTLSHSNEKVIRSNAMTAVGYLGKTQHRSEALRMTKVFLAGDNSEQGSALFILKNLHDPSWRQEAQARANSSDPSLAYAANLAMHPELVNSPPKFHSEASSTQ